MEKSSTTIVESIQFLAAKVLATNAAGHRLCLIGGFRYRLLDDSCRASVDIDYHWDGDLEAKQAEIIDVLRKKLLPEVKRQFGYDGNIRPAIGPDAESPAVRIVAMSFYRPAVAGSRIEIPLEITSIPLADMPAVRTVAGTVFRTVSDADMIESKLLALLNRSFLRVRDILDVFLFQDSLLADSDRRLSEKLQMLSVSPQNAAKGLRRIEAQRIVHVREIERILEDQVDPPAADNLRDAGGGAMIWEAVMHRLEEVLGVEEREL